MREVRSRFHQPLSVVAALLTSVATTQSDPQAKATAPPSLPPAEQNIVNVFKRVSPSVVSVANKAVVRDLSDYQLYEVPRGTGSGFIWDRKGHIVSNFHVIYGASAVEVTLHDGSTYAATVVGLHPDEDIAILKIDAPAERLTPIEPGQSANLQVGQTALAIGNPFGLDSSLSVGVVSALGRGITSMSGRTIYNVIQTDAAINPGNSGGPLLDSSGKLIGMNTAIMSPSGAYAGVGFAVPVDVIQRAVPQLIATGKVRRPTLGVRILPDHITRRSADRGVAILSVIPDGPADKAGIRGLRRERRGNMLLGDLVIEIDGKPVNSAEELAAAIDQHKMGDIIRLTLQQGKLTRGVTIKLGNED